MQRYFVIFSVLLSILSACGPEATPFPVDLPSEVSGASVAEQKIIRYALAPNTGGFIGDRQLIEASAQVQHLNTDINPVDLGTRYDIAAAYGDISNGKRSPILQNVMLVINPKVAPWQDSDILDIFRHSLQLDSLIQDIDITGMAPAQLLTGKSPAEVRSLLANAGWPDGLNFNLGDAYVPGGAAVIQRWEAAGIYAQPISKSADELQTAFTNGLLQAALIIWANPASRDQWVNLFGAENVVDLYTVPISFIAIPELTISFTPSGWPIPAH
jgi:hypothetical protein